MNVLCWLHKKYSELLFRYLYYMCMFYVDFIRNIMNLETWTWSLQSPPPQPIMACGVVVSMFDFHRSDYFHNANIYTIVPSGSNSFVLCPWMYLVFVLSTVLPPTCSLTNSDFMSCLEVIKGWVGGCVCVCVCLCVLSPCPSCGFGLSSGDQEWRVTPYTTVASEAL